MQQVLRVPAEARTVRADAEGQSVTPEQALSGPATFAAAVRHAAARQSRGLAGVPRLLGGQQRREQPDQRLHHVEQGKVRHAGMTRPMAVYSSLFFSSCCFPTNDC